MVILSCSHVLYHLPLLTRLEPVSCGMDEFYVLKWIIKYDKKIDMGERWMIGGELHKT